MLNWLLRYQRVIDLLDELGADTVLDVGAGWHGLSRWWPHHVVQTDLAFHGDPPPDSERIGTVEFVPASAEELPFTDNSFDFAVSLDMMEHLPMHLRAPAVSELARVSRRGFIIGYPVGESAARVDRRLARWYDRAGIERPEWLHEHLAQDAYPDRDTLSMALPKGWRIVRQVPSGNVLLQPVLVFLESVRGGARLSRIAERVVARNSFLSRILDLGETDRLIWLVQPYVE